MPGSASEGIHLRIECGKMVVAATPGNLRGPWEHVSAGNTGAIVAWKSLGESFSNNKMVMMIMDDMAGVRIYIDCCASCQMRGQAREFPNIVTVSRCLHDLGGLEVHGKSPALDG